MPESSTGMASSLSERPPSRESKHSSSQAPARSEDDEAHETTPLLSRGEDDENEPRNANGFASHASNASQSLHSSLQSLQSAVKSKTKNRWPSIVALAVLCLAVLAILGLGFAAPAIVEEYVQQAVVFEPVSLSVDSFTATGVRARVQGNFVLDASRVHKKSTSDIGRLGTWIVHELETDTTDVKVFLPSNDNVLLGTATVPPIKVNIRNGHTNMIDFVADLQPGDIDGIRLVANDWLDGRLESLNVRALAQVSVKSGIFPFGTHSISQVMRFEGHDLPAFPKFELESLRFTDADSPGSKEGIEAAASILLMNSYPVKFDFPHFIFDILVPNCEPDEYRLFLAKAETSTVHIRPNQQVEVNVTALVPKLRQPLIKACPSSDTSPLDHLLADYLKGKNTTVYIKAGQHQKSGTPEWLLDLMQDTEVAIPLPGHPFDNLIRKFSLADVHFTLPQPWAAPGSPESKPRVSATINTMVDMPKDMQFDIDVDRVKANADVYYKDKKMGELDLDKWTKAKTSRQANGTQSSLVIQSKIKNAPLTITNDDAFTDLVQSLIFGNKGADLGIKAKVDVHTDTVLGSFVVKQIPASGSFHVKPLGGGGGGFSSLKPEIGSLDIIDTTKSSVKLKARANITNPTDYSAHVPYANLHVLSNDTIVGSVTTEDIDIVPGRNLNLPATALWNPSEAGGSLGPSIGRNLISQYISGFNTTITLKAHKGSIPSQPALGLALSRFHITLDAPRLHGPDPPTDDDEGGPNFIRGATMHLISSTATFDLISPLPHTTLFITDIQATALYNHTISVGWIDNELPFAVPPGKSTTPRLPVTWQLGGAGYSAVKDALGGTLKLDAEANATVKIDNWQERLWYKGAGIGAHIRL